MNTVKLAAALIVTASIVGCASTGNGAVKTLTQKNAAQSIVIGKSTKADIIRTFGAASISTFPNGYEIWLYQVGYSKTIDSIPYMNLLVSSADNRKELSILFDKAGVVKKYQLMEREP